MGPKNRYLISILLFSFTLLASGQENPGFLVTDSLTYRYYLDGDWKNLIRTGKNAIQSGIDYKFLRQRLGYAYYVKGDYNEARRHFMKALDYDSYNPFTLEYLYYSYLLSGKVEYAGRWIKHFTPEMKKNITVPSNKLISAIDLEYNFKYSGSVLRSNPTYYRIGIDSKLSAGISLYQSFSKYNQKVKVLEKGSLIPYLTEQPEYYGILNINAGSRLMIRAGYHYISTSSGRLMNKGNLIILSASPDFNRFTIDLSSSLFSYKNSTLYQATLEPGFVFPGRAQCYVKSALSLLSDRGLVHIVYNPSAGIKVFRNLWFEGNYAAGDMDRYNDFKGLYVYNSYDPLILRVGGTLQCYIGKKTTLWLNYSLEKKEYFEDRSHSYKQFSYLGGIKWEL